MLNVTSLRLFCQRMRILSRENQRGIAHIGMLVLLLTVGALVATVFVAKNGTGFTNMAFDRKPLMRIGFPISLSLPVTEIGKVEMVNSEFSLLTNDGRKYRLSSKDSLSEFSGKTVLVEGKMNRESSSKDKCFLPEKCRASWWPLPDGLSFQVKNVQTVQKVDSGTYDIKFSSIKTGAYSFENVYLVPNSGGVGKPSYVRSSFLNLSGFLDKQVSVNGTVYYVGNGPDKFIDVLDIPGQSKIVHPPDNEPRDPAINRPVIIGKSCSTDQDCKMAQCKTPFACAQTNASTSCVNGKCQIRSLEW